MKVLRESSYSKNMANIFSISLEHFIKHKALDFE